jgi:hydroxymethylpyrimidine pyrophosphatase-like HAD family hydrolase
MRVLGLALDYDGTIAKDGIVDDATREALRLVKKSGRRLVLVTGRQKDDLQTCFGRLNIFDRVILENGALIIDPETGYERLLAAPPDATLLQELRRQDVKPLSVGRCIIATAEPNQGVVLDAIRHLGLELHIIFNKGQIMVLPTGINKAVGLLEALQEMGISRHAVIGIGDAENDHSFLRLCGCSATVANAVSSLKSEVDIVLEADHGAGVRLLVSDLLADRALSIKERHVLPIGTNRKGNAIALPPGNGHVLVLGPPLSGKSTFATMLTERMVERGYEFCVFDPEGDYLTLDKAAILGAVDETPSYDEFLPLLKKAELNLVVDLQKLKRSERREFMLGAIADAGKLYEQSGRPNWIIIDEAHQVFPVGRDGERLLSSCPPAVVLTYDAALVDKSVLACMDTIFAAGPRAADAIESFCKIVGRSIPAIDAEVQPGESLYWRPSSDEPPVVVCTNLPRQRHIRHAGKYADGDVGPERSFYFTGNERRLNIPATNLMEFLRLGDEVADGVWTYHLHRGDFTRWFRLVIRDPQLSSVAKMLEECSSLDAGQSRRIIREAVCSRYAPA